MTDSLELAELRAEIKSARAAIVDLKLRSWALLILLTLMAVCGHAK